MTGSSLRDAVRSGIQPFLGVYDVFSASIVGRHADNVFLSGFGFAASQFGLPDVGFVGWSDMVAYLERVRAVLPGHRILVDVDDGYGDSDIAAHVARRVERAGATGIVLEDQRRPRRCGHADGRQVLELEEFLVKLERVLAAREDLFVVARTDASGTEEIERRVVAFAEAGADAVLADGVADLELVRRLRDRAGVPVAFNQIAGGRSEPHSLQELEAAGVSIAVFSTPCLFAAQEAVDEAVRALLAPGGRLPASGEGVGLADCTRLLETNLVRRDSEE